MMIEFYKELTGPDRQHLYLKMNHLAPETVTEIEQILHTTSAAEPRTVSMRDEGEKYGEQMVEMAVSEIGLCSGHSASGVWVN